MPVRGRAPSHRSPDPDDLAAFAGLFGTVPLDFDDTDSPDPRSPGDGDHPDADHPGGGRPRSDTPENPDLPDHQRAAP